MRLRDSRLLRSTRAGLLLAIGSLFSTVAYAGQGVWTSGGPFGGFITSLAVDFTNPSTLYAGTSGAEVFKSVDSGGTWTAASSGLTGVGAPGGPLLAFAISPTTPATLYAGMEGVGVFKSTDFGGTWTAANTGLTSVGIRALAIDPSSPVTLYAGTTSVCCFGGVAGAFGGVFKSTDSGGTWSDASNGLAGLTVMALAIDPSTPTTLYAGTGVFPYGVGGIFKSIDSGGSWAAASTGLPNLYATALAIDPLNPATLYAGTSGAGIFKSTDSGGTWGPASAGLTNRDVSAFAINPSTPTTLYAGTGGGVFKSTDSGGTWVAINEGLTSLRITALALDPRGVTTLYAGLEFGSVWQSTPPPEGTKNFEGFLPIVLDVTGLAHYTSELQLTNLGAAPATVSLSYGSSIGSGSGSVLETVAAGRQVVFPDAISYLRSHGVPIPSSENQGGTLRLSAAVPDVHLTVRTGSDTVAPQPTGRAGLAYTDTDPAASSLDTTVVVYGLRTSGADRSNLAVYNMGADSVSLKVTLFSGDDARSFDVTAGVPLALPAYAWFQYSGVLKTAGYSSGYAIVERTSGNGPFGAYGVVNDQTTNDGSFIPAHSNRIRESKVTVPVLVETNAFESELILVNAGTGVQTGPGATTTFTLRYIESLSPTKGAGGTATVDVPEFQQRIIPNAIDFLRSKGVSIGARGEASYAGSLQVQGSEFFLESIFAGARTSSLSPAGGKFGVFYPAIGSSQEFSDLAYILGLKADAENRSNVAAIHTGADGSGPITLEFQVLDGSDGGKAVGRPLSVNLNPGQWVQPSGFFAAGGVSNGYVRIRRTAGAASWYAYGVINDGGQPGQRTGDGSYVPGVRP